MRTVLIGLSREDAERLAQDIDTRCQYAQYQANTWPANSPQHENYQKRARQYSRILLAIDEALTAKA